MGQRYVKNQTRETTMEKNTHDIYDRVLQIIDYKKISKRKFTEKIDVSTGYFNTVNDIGGNKLRKILNEFPDISPEWLLTGKGPMLRESVPSQAIPAPPSKGIPLIPIDAMAGLGSDGDYSFNLDTIEERYYIPDFERSKPDFMIHARGDSMTPQYNSGDVLACKLVSFDKYIQWRRSYVIDTITYGPLLKRVMPSNKEGFVLFVSENEAYPPFDVPLEDIRSIALVVGVIRLE